MDFNTLWDWKWLQQLSEKDSFNILNSFFPKLIKHHIQFPKNKTRDSLQNASWLQEVPVTKIFQANRTNFSRDFCQENVPWFKDDDPQYRNKWNLITLLTDLFACFRLNTDTFCVWPPTKTTDRLPVVSLSWNRLDLWPNSLLPCTLTQQPLETSAPIYTKHSHSWTLPLVKAALVVRSELVSNLFWGTVIRQ